MVAYDLVICDDGLSAVAPHQHRDGRGNAIYERATKNKEDLVHRSDADCGMQDSARAA